MSGLFRVIGSILGWMLRTRALRPVLVLAFLLWMLDNVVTTATDAAWFASVGKGSLWREQFQWSAGVGGIFVVLCLAISIPLMRAVARPAGNTNDEPLLPRAMRRWDTLRGRVTRIGWFGLVVVALILGRGLGQQWSEFASATSPAPASHSTNAVADFWMQRAPALQSGLDAAWTFALCLGLTALAAGALRALPFLAARPSIAPQRWLRALWCVGAALCLLRALGFAFEALRHGQIANDSVAGRMGFIFFNAVGAVGCLTVLVLLRRPRPTLALLTLGVLLLPGLGGDVLALFVGKSSLTAPTPEELKISSRSPDDWPQWDEATLLRAANLRLPRDSQRHKVEWERAGISPRKEGDGSRADIAGSPILTDEWAGHGMTDREGEIGWQSVELPEQRGSRRAQPLGPLFYGLRARPLLSDDARDVGVPFKSWLWKIAWAWRLRDPLLLLEGAQSRRLLVVRDAREVGQKLAPFWSWDDVFPRRDAQTGNAYFECVAYRASSRWPRQAPFEGGLFAGKNSVIPTAVLHLDSRTGAVHLAPFPGAKSFAQETQWRQSLPSLFNSNLPEEAPTPALEVALSGGTPLVWIRRPTGWQKKAVPVELRQALREKMDEFADTSRAEGNTNVRLEGATPALWRQDGEIFMAQAFFDLTLTQSGRTDSPTETLPLVTGVVVGPFQKRGAKWSSTLSGARTALAAPPGPVLPGKAPFVATTRPVRDLAQEALKLDNAAVASLKEGRYVEAQKQRDRLHLLLEELARNAR